MKFEYTTVVVGGNANSQIDTLVLTQPLYLNKAPTSATSAVTLAYLQQKLASIPSNLVTTGTLAVARVPAYSGDIIKAAGGSTISLTPSGVAAGWYARTNADTKGRVIAGSGLLASDIPLLPWSKFTTGKPTTVQGYNLTDVARADALNTHTGYKTLAVTMPYHPDMIASLSYLQQVVTSRKKRAGIIFRWPSTTTPAGAIRLNGGEAQKTSFPALYAAVGDSYLPAPSSAGYFRLPDYSSKELDKAYYYITT